MKRAFRLVVASCIVLLLAYSCKPTQNILPTNPYAGNKVTNGTPKIPYNSMTSSFAQPSGRFNTAGGSGGGSTAAGKQVADAPVTKRIVLVEDDQTADDALTPVAKPAAKKSTNKKPIVSRKTIVDDDFPTTSVAQSAPESDDLEPIAPKKKGKVKARTEKIDLAETNSDLTSDVNGKYHVVVGSFNVKSNATLLQSSLIADGNAGVKVVVNERGQYRVVLASYNDYQKARAKVESVSRQYSDAWVLIQGKVSSAKKSSKKQSIADDEVLGS